MLFLAAGSWARAMLSWMWDQDILPTWTPTWVDVGHVFVTVWYHNKVEPLIESESNVGPGSL